jgi:Ca2+-binding EF-hand superfamily protein
MIRIAAILVAATIAGPVAAQVPSTVPTVEDERQLTAIFQQVDANGNGQLTKMEMRTFGALHKIGSIVRNEGWSDLDTDRNGTLSRREFIDGMVKHRAVMAARQKH